MATKLSEQAKAVMEHRTVPELSIDIRKKMDMERLGDLSENERDELLNALCESLGLNRLTSPFRILSMKEGKDKYKTVVYATKDATEQLRKIYGISAKCSQRDTIVDTYIVEVEVTDFSGRLDFATGAVSLKDFYGKLLEGDRKANAYMKAETKAKRRATLSICGLGMLDESEVETITATPVSFESDDKIHTPRKLGQPEPEKEEGKTEAQLEAEALPEPELGGVVMSEKAKAEAEEEKKNPPPKHITIADSKVLFKQLNKDQVPHFKRFLIWVSTEVWKDNPPIKSTSQILKGEPYDYLLEAVTVDKKTKTSGFLMWLEEDLATSQPASPE